MNALKLHQKTVETPNRGPLLSPKQTYERFFSEGFPGKKDPGRWVRRLLPESITVRLSKTQVGYYEMDVRMHLENRRGE